MTEATPLSLRCDGIMSGTIWAFCVDEWSFECCSILQTAPKLCPQFLSLSFHFLFCFSPLLASALCKHFIAIFLHLWTFNYCCLPSFWPAISRSDPFVRNHCIFNPDLDNGTVTVIFAPGLFAALRPFMSLTLCIPLLPIIATLTNSEQCYNRNYVHATQYPLLQILISVLWTFSTNCVLLICP